MKMMQGWILTANENTAAVSFCDSPYHLSVKVEACRLIKRHPDAFAVALAIKVFPHPGGPYNSTPENQKNKKNMNNLCFDISHIMLLYVWGPYSFSMTHLWEVARVWNHRRDDVSGKAKWQCLAAQRWPHPAQQHLSRSPYKEGKKIFNHID